MMADVAYPFGGVRVGDWLTGTYGHMLLLATHTPSNLHQFIADVVTDEATTPGYARQSATGMAIIDTAGVKGGYDCDDPNFGGMTTGQSLRYLVTYRFVTNDADSPLLWLHDFDSGFDAADIGIIPIAAAGLAEVSYP